MSKKIFISSNFKNKEIDLFQTIETLWGSNLHISAYVTNEFIKDCGTPKRFQAVEKIMQEGNIYQTSYRSKQKIIFIKIFNLEKSLKTCLSSS